MDIVFVLVKPRNPLNIGACARALANFGFNDLRVVSPYAPSWREAVSAVHAQDILQKAKVFDNLKLAVSDCNTLLATTSLDRRSPTLPLISLPNILESKNLFGKKVAIIFGQEKTGLSLEDISLCNYILNIPTNPKTPSLNLAQSVVLCAYELAKNDFKKKQVKAQVKPSIKDYEITLLALKELLAVVPRPPVLNDKNCLAHFASIRAKNALSKRDLYFLKDLFSRTIKEIKK